MKVFISHKREDNATALEIQSRLRFLKVDAYLDILEGDLLLKGEKLTAHIKENLNSCTDLLAVISPITQESWWVPFEIGMAAQNDFPIVSYIKDYVRIPDYLSYWPKLKSYLDLNKYVEARIKTDKELILEKSYPLQKYASKESPTEKFYKNLRSIL
ncbi:toll/interleukin-1 receptor domain-containing protein [Candidatus Formimonas warabiya]|uniref:Cytosolic protein n=1 Tax=Formimonas warabiya TaxID=1761012 RepID=A0A3G1KWC0_FORW1|nr:toll/interleukin-1 receptor domain-containing protein [Candidatus Formimonas warabiya]ATW26720.1 cytosolic protein [Candidatus Formimonas warabiya]